MYFDRSIVKEEKQKIIDSLNDPNSIKKEYMVPPQIQNVSKMCVLTNEAINQEQSLVQFLSNLSTSNSLASQKIDTGYIFYIPETLYEQIKSNSGNIRNYIKEIYTPPNQQLIKINNEYIKKAYEGNQQQVFESNFVRNLTLPVNTGSLSVGTPLGTFLPGTSGVVGAPVVPGSSGVPAVVPGVPAVVPGVPGAPGAPVIPVVPPPVLLPSDTALLDKIKTEVIKEQLNLKKVGLTKLCGITNVGNTCYLNSSIQLLYSMIELRVFLLNISTDRIKQLNGSLMKGTPPSISPISPTDDIENKKIFLALKKLFEEIHKTPDNGTVPSIKHITIENGTEYEGTIFNNILCKMAKNSIFKKDDQQDAEEFMNSILGCFKDYILNEALIVYIYELFDFNNIDSFECDNGTTLERSNTSNTSGDTSGTLLTLGLESFTNNTTITQLINKHQEKEKFSFPNFPKISDSAGNFNTNESCGPLQEFKENGIIKLDKGKSNEYNAKSKQILVKIPDKLRYILIQLKRFKTNPLDVKNPTKISISIDFEKELTIDNKKFKISGIVRQGGTLKGGHYRYEIFDKDENPSKILDDSRVVDSPPTDTYRKEQAYVLLYQRVDITPPIVPPPPPLTPTNLNGKPLKYLQIPIKIKTGEKSIITNLQESLKINKTDKTKIFIGCDENGIDILKNDSKDKQFDNRTDIARLIRYDNEHISFSTFKINDNYEKKLKNFKLSEVGLSQLTFQFNSIKYLPNQIDKKKVIVEILDMTDANVDYLINTTIPNKIMELTGLTGLKKNTYTLNGTKWTSTDTAIKDKTITTDLDKKYFSSNVKSIDSYCDDNGNEMIRFFNYNPIELHITLSQQQQTPPKPALLTSEDIDKFNKALEHLFKKIENVFITNKPSLVPFIFDNTTYFEFPNLYKSPLKSSKAP